MDLGQIQINLFLRGKIVPRIITSLSSRGEDTSMGLNGRQRIELPYPVSKPISAYWDRFGISPREAGA